MADWILDGDPGMDLWHMDVRRFGRAVPLAGLHAGPRPRELRELLRHPLPGQPSGRRAGRCAPRPPTPGTPRTARCSARRPAGSGSNHYATPGRRRSCGRAGWAGRHWSPCVRARAPGGPRVGGRCSTRRRSPRSRSPGRTRRRSARTCSPGGSDRPPGAVVYTQALNDRGGIEMDVTVTRLGRGRVPRGHRHRVRRARPGLAAPAGPADRRRRADRRRDRRLGVLRALGAAGPGRCWRRSPRRRWPTADFPFLTMRETTVGDVPVRALRVTYVGELGWELYCPTEYGAALWRDAGRHRRARPGGLPGDREPAAGEGLPGLGLRHRPGDHPRRGRPAVRRAARAAGSSGGRGAAAAREPGVARRLRCLVLDDPRAVALGGEPVRGRATTRRRAGDLRRLRLHGGPLDRLRLPARGPWDRAAASRCGRTATGGCRGGAGPLYDPKGEPRPHLIRRQLGEGLQDVLAVLRELGLADAADRAQRGEDRRACAWRSRAAWRRGRSRRRARPAPWPWRRARRAGARTPARPRRAARPAGFGRAGARAGRLLRARAAACTWCSPAQHRPAGLGEHERLVLALDRQHPLGHELADHPAPLGLGQVGADAEHRQRVVVELLDLRRALAEQDVDDLPGAELLPPLPVEPEHGGEHLLRGHRAVPRLGRGQAGVAVAARLRRPAPK